MELPVLWIAPQPAAAKSCWFEGIAIHRFFTRWCHQTWLAGTMECVQTPINHQSSYEKNIDIIHGLHVFDVSMNIDLPASVIKHGWLDNPRTEWKFFS